MRLLFLFLLLSSTVISCSFNKDLRPLEELARSDKITEYRINGGDIITVDVWGEPKLSGQQYVREDGRFNLSLIGEVEVAGKTTAEVESILTKKLSDYIPAASVAVSIFKQAPIKYYLSGSFQTAGEYRSDGPITFLQAIASGGGFAVFADESEIYLIRKTAGGDLRYRLNYSRVISGKQPNPELRSGDIIAVQ